MLLVKRVIEGVDLNLKSGNCALLIAVTLVND